jgi:hypothetical protein
MPEMFFIILSIVLLVLLFFMSVFAMTRECPKCKKCKKCHDKKCEKCEKCHKCEKCEKCHECPDHRFGLRYTPKNAHVAKIIKKAQSIVDLAQGTACSIVNGIWTHTKHQIKASKFEHIPCEQVKIEFGLLIGHAYNSYIKNLDKNATYKAHKDEMAEVAIKVKHVLHEIANDAVDITCEHDAVSIEKVLGLIDDVLDSICSHDV